jgi:hypothetical protein
LEAEPNFAALNDARRRPAARFALDQCCLDRTPAPLDESSLRLTKDREAAF